MKQCINKIIIAFVLFSSFSVSAYTEFKVEAVADQMIKVNIDRAGETSQLVLRDQNNKVLFKKQGLTDNYNQMISLTNLPQGLYTIALDSDDLISTKTIIKTDSQIQVSETEVAFKPHFKTLKSSPRKLMVMFTNPTFDVTHLKVYDPKGELITDVEAKEAVLNRVLDFSDVPSGKYSIAINNKGRNFYQNFLIK